MLQRKISQSSNEPMFDLSSWVKGAVGGGIGILASHWLDTIKTHYQTNNTKSVFESASQLYLQGGTRAFMRGIGSPLIGMIWEKAIVFGTQQNVYNSLSYTNEYLKTFISGGTAGVICTSVVTPVEYFKIKMQSGESFGNICKNIFYQGPTKAIRSVYNGLPATIIREGPGFAVYFTTYSFLKRNLTTIDTFTPFHAMGFGALSGATAWASMYPSDSIKTMQQRFDISFVESARRIYSSYGIMGFYRAFDLAMMRAVPLHAGVFGGVSIVTYIMNGHY